MELQALGVPMAPVDQRVLQGCLEELVSQALWARRVSQGRLATPDPQDLQASLVPREKLVKRGTLAHLGLLGPQARKAPLERMEQKGMWAPQGSQETRVPLETLEFQVKMAPQGRRETLVMLGDRVHLALLGKLAPQGPLAKGVLLVAWVEKAEKGRKAQKGNQVLTGPQGGQAQ